MDRPQPEIDALINSQVDQLLGSESDASDDDDLVNLEDGLRALAGYEKYVEEVGWVSAFSFVFFPAHIGPLFGRNLFSSDFASVRMGLVYGRQSSLSQTSWPNKTRCPRKSGGGSLRLQLTLSLNCERETQQKGRGKSSPVLVMKLKLDRYQRSGLSTFKRRNCPTLYDSTASTYSKCKRLIG